MDTAALPAWLTPGAAVASVQDDRRATLRVAKTTVARIGKRDVVLTNGERFSARDLKRHEGGTWGWSVKLLPASDPAVAEVEAQIREARARSGALKAIDEWRVGAGAGSDPRPVIAAFAALLPDDQRDRILGALTA